MTRDSVHYNHLFLVTERREKIRNVMKEKQNTHAIICWICNMFRNVPPTPAGNSHYFFVRNNKN